MRSFQSSKVKSKQSYTTNRVNGNIKLQDGHIKLPKLQIGKNQATSRNPFGICQSNLVRFRKQSQGNTIFLF